MPSVFAIVAHPDDIEYFCAGTLLRLLDLGWDLHYVNLCDGSRGSTTMDRETCARVRYEESIAACKVLGAKLYRPIYPDMEAAYTTGNLRRVAAYIRQAKPSIILTHSPSDYMEDHETACRLAVSAAFTHAMPNFETDPPEPVYHDPVTVYHAQPLGNRLPLGEVVKPHFYVDTTSVIDRQIEALACHASQDQWLDQSQGVSNYLEQLKTLAREVGTWSGRYEYAEGWRRHQHYGFCGPNDDPLRDALA